MKNLLLLLFLFLASNLTFSQSEEKKKMLVNNTVYEKVYLHIDREAYAPREDVWYKAYLVSGISNKLIQGYKNIYIQLVSDSGLVVKESLLLTNNGVAQGDFSIPYDIDEGQYTIRAFTKYLQNFGEESYFHKKIWISEMKRQNISEQGSDSLKIDVGFYPESGNFVLNTSNTIAFKAVNSKGYGIPITGYVINDLKDTITPFSTGYLGMGKFALMPREGRSYFVELNEYPEFKYQFNDIQAQGVTLQYKDKIVHVKFGIARNFSVATPEKFKLRASHKGIQLLEAEIEIHSFYNEIAVAKEYFPLGISKVTLVDENEQIVAERLIFIKVDAPPVIKITPSKTSYKARTKAEISLQSFLPEDDSLFSGASIAIINRDYLTRDGYVSDIRSYLLLDSELKGHIEASGSYFSDEGATSSSQKLDLLMMVQGWRSYYWPEIIAKAPQRLIGWSDIGIRVKGHVKRLLRDKPVIDGTVSLGPLSSSFTYIDSYTDENGNFQFDRLYLRDSSMLMIQAKSMGGNNRTEIFIDEIYMPEEMTDQCLIDSVIATPIIPDSYYGNNFTKLEAERKYAMESGTYWLDEVEIVTGRKESVLNLTEDADRTYGMPQRRFEITDEDMTYMNILDYLEGRLPGVVVSGGTISIRGGQTPTILLDGIINELVDISTLPMGDIDHVDIFYSGGQLAAFGSMGADGVIAIYTKSGTIDTDFVRYVRGRLSTRVDGFQTACRFYSPKYNIDNLETEMPDYRPTLYWNPTLKFEDRNARIEFFTSDFISKYLVIVEGISSKGTICTGVGSFDVGW
jgi:hypothetical protein